LAEETDVVGKLIIKLNFRECKFINGIKPAQDMFQWWILLKIATGIWVP
jgi:hypothetical protein